MFDPADRRKQILYKAVAALARRERSRLGLYKKLSETFNEEGDKELINSVLDELVNKKYLSDERYARNAQRQIRRPQALLKSPAGRCLS